MKVVREDNLYQVTFSNPEGLSVNCYLVAENDHLTLVDTAVPFAAEGILEVISRIGKPIGRIVLTHGHHDHTGGLSAIMQAVPGVPVYISSREARVIAGDRTFDPGEPGTPIRGSFPRNVNTQAFVWLQEGDRIGSLLAVAAPGHTPGSMAFLDTRNQALLAGDAFQTAGGIAVAGQLNPAFPFPALGTWNSELALESARKLCGLRPVLLGTGHGDMLKEPLPDMARAIAASEHTLQPT